MAWGPKQVQGDCLKFQIVPLPFGPARSAFSDIAFKMESGIGVESLVSMPQTHLSWMYAFKNLCSIACFYFCFPFQPSLAAFKQFSGQIPMISKCYNLIFHYILSFWFSNAWLLKITGSSYLGFPLIIEKFLCLHIFFFSLSMLKSISATVPYSFGSFSSEFHFDITHRISSFNSLCA